MPDVEAFKVKTAEVFGATVETVTLPNDEEGLFLCLIDIGNEVGFFAGFERTLWRALGCAGSYRSSKNFRILRIVEPKRES